MTRFITATVLAYLLAVPARAESCQPLHLYPDVATDTSCLSVQCHGYRLLREAYQRGEIATVHLSRKSECSSLRGFEPRTGETIAVPCIWDHNDYFVGQ